ncbi:glycoside hydrolase family 15 protein [Dactylosporangium sucinum]|uniref:glycoside hydrolase family 15 protein n=1 Tax=Dactylosporangium sucinum TaxID=1424081 RepID=UPI00167ED070|nr:glycoside hydrolase family 15 protein [Dactylosporangium sucinum]
MNRYPDISDHGLIGDLQTAALVSGDGTVDWWCCPRFDSPSVFAALLDADRGGYFRIAPDTVNCVSRQLYLPDTGMLITRFMTPEGVGEVVDFMPIAGAVATDRHRLVRMMRTVRGTMRFTIDIRPRFDYGRAPHKLDLSSDGAVFAADGLELTVHPVGVAEHDRDLQRDGDDLHMARTLREGQIAGVVLESMGGRPTRLPVAELERLGADTARYWRDWVNASTYRGRWRETVARSAITLKLLTYAPTGAPVAAPTAGLPELTGGERNWDYRYTWIRDGSFSVRALLGLGYVEEAAAFGGWLRDRTVESSGTGSGPLKIMYRVDGSSDLTEETLEHFEGWRGSRPVRIGNDAADQLQLDVYGEALDALHRADSQGQGMAYQGWMSIARIIDWLCEHWDQPEEGIWETRGGRKDFTYGRFQSWVAFDRAIRLAVDRGRPGEIARWATERDNIYRQIMSRAWNPDTASFTQHYGSDVLDAALLLMPQLGFIAPTDPMWLSTLDAIDRELVSDSLVYRYNPAASPDGLRGHEGTFSLCTFWYVDALAEAGRLTEARLVLDKMLTYANPLGLYAEEIGLTGEQLGNFPQAFSHLSLINTAIRLNHRLDHGVTTTVA